MPSPIAASNGTPANQQHEADLLVQLHSLNDSTIENEISGGFPFWEPIAPTGALESSILANIGAWVYDMRPMIDAANTFEADPLSLELAQMTSTYGMNGNIVSGPPLVSWRFEIDEWDLGQGGDQYIELGSASTCQQTGDF